MQIVIVKDQVEGGKKAFDLVENALTAGELKVMGLATGSTPITLYQEMCASELDFSDVVAINLDEYIGLQASDPQSYHTFMENNLFAVKPFKATHIPNGLATDAEAECARYDQVIAENPIDIQILGIGTNGHIGFNEPGTPFDAETRKVDLVDETIEANKRFFAKKEDVPTQAYSMGTASILKAKKIILLAFGAGKVDAIQAMVEGPITEACPASALQNHDNVYVIVDEAAAAKLRQ